MENEELFLCVDNLREVDPELLNILILVCDKHKTLNRKHREVTELVNGRART